MDYITVSRCRFHGPEAGYCSDDGVKRLTRTNDHFFVREALNGSSTVTTRPGRPWRASATGLTRLCLRRRIPSWPSCRRSKNRIESRSKILTWVLPDWVTIREYGFLLSATMLALGWVATESLYAVPLSRLRDATVVNRFAASTARLPAARLATGVAAAAVLMGLCLIVLLPVSGGQTTLYLGLGLLLLTRGIGTPTPLTR